MFDGSSEQFHQFIASSTTASLPISLPFPLHAFDHPYAPPSLHHQPPPPPSESRDPWSNDELLSLLKLRSTMEIWFPDFTWEHVSRKLGELGFKRSAEQCKEKFEEESRNFNTSKSYRMMSELDDFCHGDDDQDREKENPKKVEEEEEEIPAPQQVLGKKAISSKKRKRREKFETFKGFCEAVVKKMMAKQEELHNKLIQDILKRDEEKIARDEAWKNQEMERFRTQIESRSKDQKSAAQRQAAIIEFLTHFTSHNNDKQEEEEQQQQQEDQEQEEEELNNKSNSNSSSSIPPSLPPPPPSPSPTPASDVGKRWPRDEVVALINLRCKMSGEQENNNSKEGSSSTKGPLWERISQGMKEMGYKRSAKRCKEKWENINKYFRKTKDSSKKRSLNSRTCPYFHHLSSLYGDGTIIAPTAASASAPVVDLGGERAAVDVDVDGVF